MEDDDLLLQLGHGAGGGGLIDERFFEVFLLLGVEVVVVLGDIGERLGEDLLAADAELLLPHAAFEPFLAAFEGLEDGLRAGSEATLEGGEGEADGAFARAVELVGLAHFRLDVVRDGLVERGFDVGELVVDRVRLALGEEGVPSNFTISSFTMRRMRSEQSTL